MLSIWFSATEFKKDIFDISSIFCSSLGRPSFLVAISSSVITFTYTLNTFTKCAMDDCTDRSINQSINQSISQLINQSTNQSINQSIRIYSYK